MAWLFLGVVALPLAAGLYLLAQRLAPHVLEAVPEAGPRQAPGPATRQRWQVSASELRYARAGAAIAVLALAAFGVSRWPAPREAVPPAVAVQLPAPAPLKVQARLDTTGEGRLRDPRDIAIDAAGNVYVADTGNKRIAKFRPDGSLASSWAAAAQGALVEPSSLAVVADGIVVDDSEAARLHKYDFDGNPVPGFEHDLGLSHPRGVAASPDGTLLVGDTANNRIVRVGPDGASRGVFDTRGTKLEQPTGVVVDDKGAVYSIEPAASRIQKFAPDGSLQAHLFLPPSVTLFPPRGAWMPGHGLAVTLPEQNEVVTYDATGVPRATYIPEGALAARPIGLSPAPGKPSVWVVWNVSASAAELLWP